MLFFRSFFFISWLKYFLTLIWYWQFIGSPKIEFTAPLHRPCQTLPTRRRPQTDASLLNMPVDRAGCIIKFVRLRQLLRSCSFLRRLLQVGQAVSCVEISQPLQTAPHTNNLPLLNRYVLMRCDPAHKAWRKPVPTFRVPREPSRIKGVLRNETSMDYNPRYDHRSLISHE